MVKRKKNESVASHRKRENKAKRDAYKLKTDREKQRKYQADYYQKRKAKAAAMNHNNNNTGFASHHGSPVPDGTASGSPPAGSIGFHANLGIHQPAATLSGATSNGASTAFGEGAASSIREAAATRNSFREAAATASGAAIGGFAGAGSPSGAAIGGVGQAGGSVFGFAASRQGQGASHAAFSHAASGQGQGAFGFGEAGGVVPGTPGRGPPGTPSRAPPGTPFTEMTPEQKENHIHDKLEFLHADAREHTHMMHAHNQELYAHGTNLTAHGTNLMEAGSMLQEAASESHKRGVECIQHMTGYTSREEKRNVKRKLDSVKRKLDCDEPPVETNHNGSGFKHVSGEFSLGLPPTPAKKRRSPTPGQRRSPTPGQRRSDRVAAQRAAAASQQAAGIANPSPRSRNNAPPANLKPPPPGNLKAASPVPGSPIAFAPARFTLPQEKTTEAAARPHQDEPMDMEL